MLSCKSRGLANFFDGQGASVHIALGTLHVHHAHAFSVMGESCFYAIFVDFAVLCKGDLRVFNAEISKAAHAGVSVFAYADNVVQRVIGLSGDGKHDVARAQQPEQGNGERMGTAHD